MRTKQPGMSGAQAEALPYSVGDMPTRSRKRVRGNGARGVILDGSRLLSRGRPPPPRRCALCAVPAVGTLVWRQWCPAVGTIARDGPRGVILDGSRLLSRGCPPPICRCAPCAVPAVGRLAWQQRCPTVCTVARVGHGRVLWSSTKTYTFERILIMAPTLPRARRRCFFRIADFWRDPAAST